MSPVPDVLAVDSSSNGFDGAFRGVGVNTFLAAGTITGNCPRFHTTDDGENQGVEVLAPALDTSLQWAFRLSMVPEMNNDFTDVGTQEECVFEFGDIYLHHRTIDLQLIAHATVGATSHTLTWSHDEALTDGAPHDVVFQYTGFALELWVDSSLVVTTAASGITSGEGPDLLLSKGASANAGEWFDGLLDEFTFYPDALTVDPTDPPPIDPPPAPGTIALVSGLLGRDSVYPQLKATAGYCPEINWSAAQTSEGGAISAATQTFIEGILAGPHPARFRLMAGFHAPSWLKAIVGTTTIHYAQSPSDPPEDVVNFWDSRVSDAKADLLTKLAALYDGDIQVFFDSGPSVLYSEPFLIQASYPLNRTRLLANGYSIAQHKANIQADIEAMGAFTLTNLALAFNPLSTVKPDGTQGTDANFTWSMMDHMRDLYEGRAILQNNSLRNSFFKQQIYKEMRDRGAPLSMQTSTISATGMTDIVAVLDYCVNMGCHAVELPNGFATYLSTAQRRYYDAALIANAG